jgi:hypothetical protein
MSSEIAAKLREQTSSLVGTFTERLSSLKDRPEIAVLTKQANTEAAIETAKDYVDQDGNQAVGIDGSMDYDERLEMLLFYVCATAFRCPLKAEGGLGPELREAERDSRLSTSAAVPLWLEDLSDVTKSPQFVETGFDFERSVERIPFAMMTLAELSLALRSLDNDKVKVIFLDRPISGTWGPASRDLRLLLRSGVSSLTFFETPHGKLTMLDLSIASVLGPGDAYVPVRALYSTYAGIQRLLEKGELSRGQLAHELGLDDDGIDKLAKRLNRMNDSYNGQLLEKTGPSLKLCDGVGGYWDRVVDVSKQVLRKLFEDKGHPLKLEGNRWLTVLDLNAVNAFLIFRLMEESIARKVLVIGITKDTSATDFTRSVIPLTVRRGLLILKSPLPNLKNDRAFLTMMAAVNAEAIPTPWRTLGYDNCFTALVESGEGEGAPPLRAARKFVSRERLFVKAYFQLRNFRTDPHARSPIFVYDRFFNGLYDKASAVSLSALEGDKVVEINPYFEGPSLNPIDNLVLCLLSRSDNPEVLEACGHNQLLYLADKAVKAEIKLMRSMLRSVADLELGTLARRERIFSISRRFRDLRAESEMARASAAHEGVR